MARLKNKTIIKFNEKDLQDRLKQARTELFKLNVESKKVRYGKKVESLNHFEKILQEC